VLMGSCGVKPAERLDVLFDAASDDLHAGELAKDQLAAEHAISVAASRHDLLDQWKFRLLRCEILFYSGRAEEVLNELRDGLPQTPQLEVV